MMGSGASGGSSSGVSSSSGSKPKGGGAKRNLARRGEGVQGAAVTSAGSMGGDGSDDWTDEIEYTTVVRIMPRSASRGGAAGAGSGSHRLGDDFKTTAILLGMVVMGGGAMGGAWMAAGRPSFRDESAWRTNPRVNTAVRAATAALPGTTESSLRGYELAEEELPARVLGHLRVAEAPRHDLRQVSADGQITMRTAAAKMFLQMQGDARKDGVLLIPLSGFRSIADQQDVFFGTAKDRNQVASERARVSAPPGYSEHHTGYALDIGDGKAPWFHLDERFERTKASIWLYTNAAKYNFELSFPRNNEHGIMYEPWHWRYVGDRHSLETFYGRPQPNKN